MIDFRFRAPGPSTLLLLREALARVRAAGLLHNVPTEPAEESFNALATALRAEFWALGSAWQVEDIATGVLALREAAWPPATVDTPEARSQVASAAQTIIGMWEAGDEPRIVADYLRHAETHFEGAAVRRPVDQVIPEAERAERFFVRRREPGAAT